MKTEQPNQSAAVFLQTVSVALTQLKQRLQHDYERAYPDYADLHRLIRIVVDAEEARARDLTLFPHLLLPDMVEARLASLNLHRVRTKHMTHFASPNTETGTQQPAFASCG